MWFLDGAGAGGRVSWGVSVEVLVVADVGWECGGGESGGWDWWWGGSGDRGGCCGGSGGYGGVVGFSGNGGERGGGSCVGVLWGEGLLLVLVLVVVVLG